MKTFRRLLFFYRYLFKEIAFFAFLSKEKKSSQKMLQSALNCYKRNKKKKLNIISDIQKNKIFFFISFQYVNSVGKQNSDDKIR